MPFPEKPAGPLVLEYNADIVILFGVLPLFLASSLLVLLILLYIAYCRALSLVGAATNDLYLISGMIQQQQPAIASGIAANNDSFFEMPCMHSRLFKKDDVMTDEATFHTTTSAMNFCFNANLFYDSPPTNRRFPSTNVSWLLGTRNGVTKNMSSSYFLFPAKTGLSTDDVESGRKGQFISGDTAGSWFQN